MHPVTRACVCVSVAEGEGVATTETEGEREGSPVGEGFIGGLALVYIVSNGFA